MEVSHVTRTHFSRLPCIANSKRSCIVKVHRCMPSEVQYDRLKELKAFDDTKAGVKGLVDASGKILNIPKMFVRPLDELAEDLTRGLTRLQVPTIDLSGIESGSDRRKEVVEQIGRASENWGFFQVVNHGIPKDVLYGMLYGVRMFHEQDLEVKKQFYSRDQDKMVKYNSNYDLYKSRAARWRDTFSVSLQRSDLRDPHDIPSVCRYIICPNMFLYSLYPKMNDHL